MQIPQIKKELKHQMQVLEKEVKNNNKVPVSSGTIFCWSPSASRLLKAPQVSKARDR